MKSHNLSAIIFATTLAAVLYAPPARALSSQTYVSKISGNDANAALAQPCNLTHPCLQIFTALNATTDGGTITILDGTYPEGVGALSQSVTLDAYPGTQAEIHGTWQIASSTGVITIRNVTFRGFGVNNFVAITINGGQAVILDHVLIEGLGGGGVVFAPNTAASSGTPTQLHISNSTFANNFAGNILIKPTNGIAVAATLDRVNVRNGIFGIKTDSSGQSSGQIDVDVIESIAAANTSNGFIAVSNVGQAPVHFMIDRSTAHNNGAFGAVGSGAQAFMIVSNSTLAKNGTGLAQQNGATVATYTNNGVNFNTTNTSGTITPIGQK